MISHFAFVFEINFNFTQNLQKKDSIDIPELEVVQQPPQATFEDYPEELIKDVIQVHKTSSIQPKNTSTDQTPADKPIELSN